MSQSPDNSAAGIQWDLRDLYQSVDDPAIDKDLAQAHKRALAFEKKFRGRIQSLKTTQTKILLKAVVELESLYEQMDRPLV
jgi:oligoendopeptidase F